MILTKIQQEKIRREFKLSNREIEILTLLCSGVDSTKVISETLGIAQQTTKVFLQRIFLKLGVRTKLKSVVKAIDSLNLR